MVIRVVVRVAVRVYVFVEAVVRAGKQDKADSSDLLYVPLREWPENP